MAEVERNPRVGLNAAVAAVLRGELAARRDLKQDDLVRATGISKPSVQRYLAGDRHLNLTVVQLLAEALDLTVAEVFDSAAERMRRDEGHPEGDAGQTA